MRNPRDTALFLRDVALFLRDMAKNPRDMALAFYVSIMLIKDLDAIEKALQDNTRFYKNLVCEKGSLNAPFHHIQRHLVIDTLGTNLCT